MRLRETLNFRSALYVGSVIHRRLRPHVHRLRYRLFWLLLDLDEIDRLSKSLRLFSHNRFNAVSFHDADHGDDSGRPLRDQVEQHLIQAGIGWSGGTIRLLCMPRIFGYGFNPLSVYFCHHCDGQLAAVLYEVHNTFGERHSYLIAAGPSAGAVLEQQCRKVFYVSPFMDMALTYQFRVAIPGERVSVAIRAVAADGVMLAAVLAGRRQDISDLNLLRLLATHPLLTLKVIAAIHWHALRMLLKGYRSRARPAPPALPVTSVDLGGQSP
ncbi:MAG: DUF1365 family protein [Xanthobacteraceae bacterium]